MKSVKLILLICLLSCFQSYHAFACRYNVRETGFVDLGIEPYYLYGYVNHDTPADISSSFKQISYAALMDSNIEVEIIETSQQKDHPAMKYLDLWPIQSFPSAVLVSPDGRSLPIAVTKPDRPFKETLWSALDDIISSPKSEIILRQVSETYGVVLLIEGTDADENKMAKVAASGAIEKISRLMESMPKRISHPPVMVVINSESVSREKNFLWSLGLDVDKVSKPHAAVLYGRFRWIGPLLKGKEITETSLAAILFVIGEDCECGIDQRWLKSTMLPARWDEKTQARVAETLGFDPENPMVKMEISRIMRKESPSHSNVPFGYQEFVVESVSVNNAQQMLPAQAKKTALPPSAAASSISEESVLAENESTIKKPLYFIAGLTVLIIIAGLFILLRAARRNL